MSASFYFSRCLAASLIIDMRRPSSSNAAGIAMQAYKEIGISRGLHSPKVPEQLVDEVYSIPKHTHFEIFFHHINNVYRNINFTMEEINRKLAFLDTFLE